MSQGHCFLCSIRVLTFAFGAAVALACVQTVYAEQFDIPGPVGSVQFGAAVFGLPNGNFVVNDPEWDSAAGAVYLYSADRVLISTLTGSNPNDRIGSGADFGIIVVGDSNFVVISPQWMNGDGDLNSAGAVTWVNGVTGLSGVVSGDNSLIGTSLQDSVGADGVVVLSNGNYVVLSSSWNGGAGAASWGNGATGISGPVSNTNSLVGTMATDQVGLRATALTNGNYVVTSPGWNNGIGAATWGSGVGGVSGAVTFGNSLTGTIAGDSVGSAVAALQNGNYLVTSPSWNNGTPLSHFGAATWGNGSTGITGAVSTGNSLYGTTIGDSVGNSHGPALALSNGNYVVSSANWNNGIEGSNVGAATWGDGSSGTTGAVSAGNSLIGSSAIDRIGARLTALSNGNYVAASSNWDNGAALDAGAVTWCNGNSGTTGVVSPANSLVGTTTGDLVGQGGATALSNGNYVVASPSWSNGTPASAFGAVTWGEGNSGVTGVVSDTNSLIGTTALDRVGLRVVALGNGNYVVASSDWNNGVPTSKVGAVTWGNGASGISGAVSAGNSLIGVTNGDRVGGGKGGVMALQNGNYVVPSPSWNGNVGASTWANGSTGVIGIISAANSLIGGAIDDIVGSGRSAFYSDSNYSVASPQWSGLGAVTLASGAFRLKGTIESWNSVIGAAIAITSYTTSGHKLIVGRPQQNTVSVLTLDQVFAGDMEP